MHVRCARKMAIDLTGHETCLRKSGQTAVAIMNCSPENLWAKQAKSQGLVITSRLIPMITLIRVKS